MVTSSSTRSPRCARRKYHPVHIGRPGSFLGEIKLGSSIAYLAGKKDVVLLSGISGSEVGRPASATRTSQRSYCDTDAVKPKACTDVLLLPITWNLPTSPKTWIHANHRKGRAGGVVYIHDPFSCSMHARSERMGEAPRQMRRCGSTHHVH